MKMEINVGVIIVDTKDHEGVQTTKMFAPKGMGLKHAEMLEKAEIVKFTDSTGEGAPALKVYYRKEAYGTYDIVCEIFPLEYVSIRMNGRRW